LSIDIYAYLKEKDSSFWEIKKGSFFSFFDNIAHLFNIPFSIQIVGTNGKGSTGRFLTQILRGAKKSVFHYTSPHIISVNERFYINDSIIEDEVLNSYHLKLLALLGRESSDTLTYFEYLTILAFFISQDFDIAVFEAGVGREYDATSAKRPDLLLVTPISFDHKHILGESLGEIVKTKLAKLPEVTILGIQEYAEAEEMARVIAKESGKTLKTIDDILDVGDKDVIKQTCFNDFLKNNLLLAASAAKEIGLYSKDYLPKKLDIRGRCEKIDDYTIIDVGHNESAARAVCASFMGKKFNLVYNSLADKEYCKVLEIFKNHCEKIYILPIDADRAVQMDELLFCATSLGFMVVSSLADFEGEMKVVFGSFHTVESYLKRVA